MEKNPVPPPYPGLQTGPGYGAAYPPLPAHQQGQLLSQALMATVYLHKVCSCCGVVSICFPMSFET